MSPLVTCPLINVGGPGDEGSYSAKARMLNGTEDIHDVGAKVTKGAPSASVSSDDVTTDFLEVVEIGGNTSRVQALHVKHVLQLWVLEALPLYHLGEDCIESLRASIHCHIREADAGSHR